jgi:hypothetical protein
MDGTAQHLAKLGNVRVCVSVCVDGAPEVSAL